MKTLLITLIIQIAMETGRLLTQHSSLFQTTETVKVRAK